MPSTFARGTIREKFDELIEALARAIEEDRSGGQSQNVERMENVLAKVDEAKTDFEAMGGPQGGSVG